MPRRPRSDGRRGTPTPPTPSTPGRSTGARTASRRWWHLDPLGAAVAEIATYATIPPYAE
ncbi:hypothetical protein [uncultured Microbacterium sp.]|uniref:hypothetical protein n=1 Tax=uncultured Microbacterium sp. TaxID=191216 RepID=UPI002611AFD9|nr:hypothetical protein [uncultured Microbacterium sp.]